MKIAFPKSVLNHIVSFLQVLPVYVPTVDLQKATVLYWCVCVGWKGTIQNIKNEQIRKKWRRTLCPPCLFLFVVIQKLYFVVAKQL